MPLTAPYLDTRAVKLLAKRIDALAGRKNQREIAREVGFTNANIMSMMKNGESKIPLERVPALAKALEVDPGHLFRLVFEQHFRSADMLAVINQVFGTIVSENEQQWLKVIREASNETDPELTPAMAERLREIVAMGAPARV